MTRILSAIVLIPVVLGAIWYAPHWALLLLLEAVLVAAFLEYAGLMEKSGVPVPAVASGTAAAVACAAVGWPGVPVDLMLIAVFLAASVTVLAAWQPAPHVPATAAATLFPVLYLGLPIGTIAAIRWTYGREAVLLVLLTVWVSDSAQYYAGTLLGKHRLSPTISPKKSVEGALGGLVAGVAVMVGLGRLWVPQLGLPLLAGLGAILVALGIAGDLFESLLKRSANVKDSSALIPGHGGVLDRIDALLFVAPGFYLFLRLLA
ncbi:MAG: phosphatidate cytidylyltransferase [Acidobacteria bacterium]|nr:phosphatidate cytidylyltransferase [Acidobacteriota bacterium]